MVKHQQKRALVRVFIFGLITIIFIGSSVYGLVSNSRGAKQRYDTLIAVDQAGGDVETALNELRVYIYNHMNTQIGSDLGVKPPIQLKGTYERLVAVEEARIAKENEPLYARAQADCETRLPNGFSGSNRTECIEAFVDANGVEVNSIEDDFYKFDFVPPRWSPDIAGLSMLFAVLFGLMFALESFMYFRTKRMVELSN
jgi:hypothetical protein